MKAVRVQYTVKPEYVETNKENIKAVMNHLEDNPIVGMWYKAFLLEDGQSFMHVNICDSEETMGKLSEVEPFNKFRMELKASGPIAPPKSETITMI
jgi:hypothetical protein